MNSDKYSILFLSSWYPTKLLPFQGDFVKRHAKSVSLYSNVVCLHVIKDENLDCKLFIEENSESNFNEVIFYFKSRYFTKLLYIYYYLFGYRYIRKKFGKPDLIHGNVLLPIGLIVLLLSFLHRIPYVITEHWTGYQNGIFNRYSRLKKYFYQYVAKKAKYLFPVTKNLSEEMIKSGINGSYLIIPNVVEIDVFTGLRDDQKDIKTILHVSNLKDDHKNVSGILRTILALSKKRQDFVLHIIHNHDNKYLFEYAEKLNILNKFVRFQGKKNTKEVAEYMSKSAFLVLFSNYENLPCVIVEAFASGLPVLSTDVGGIKEHLDSKKGVLIQKGDEEALFEKMNFMLDHYHEFNKKALRDYANEHFSYKKIGHKYYKIYQEIIHV